jgi:hypothetical protein
VDETDSNAMSHAALMCSMKETAFCVVEEKEAVVRRKSGQPGQSRPYFATGLDFEGCRRR